MELGKLRFLNPRETFPTEPTHFSKWVGDNLDRLGEVLGLELELLKREAEVGSFSLDILARVVGTDDLVIIENQIEPTDHRHLGQILTYASGLDARHIVWISPTFREEHRAALDWLNVNTVATRHFFGIQVEVLRIDDSKPAVNFRTVVLPNEWQKSAAQIARSTEAAPDQEQLNAVFERIYEIAAASGAFVRLLKPLSRYTDYVLERTHQGAIVYAVNFGRNQLRSDVFLYHADSAVNTRLFELLKARSDSIQEGVNGAITWDFQESRRRQVIRVVQNIDRAALASQIDKIANLAAERLIELRKSVEQGLEADIAEAFVRTDQSGESEQSSQI